MSELIITVEEEALFRAAVRNVCTKIVQGGGTIGWYWMGLEALGGGTVEPAVFAVLIHDANDYVILIPKLWEGDNRAQVDAIGRDEVRKFSEGAKAS